MNSNTWVDAVVRFARNRADRLLPVPCHRSARAPNYDIPAFIRRGIRIPALESFHGKAATRDTFATTLAARADCGASAQDGDRREES